ncbi:hypothetical protein, partial [Bartonella queenslandensis]|uniref:hypothetical protein n=1 Tax=Bartonella queenslandensis TaxID=481138 RepID=UPI001AEC4028
HDPYMTGTITPITNTTAINHTYRASIQHLSHQQNSIKKTSPRSQNQHKLSTTRKTPPQTTHFLLKHNLLFRTIALFLKRAKE